MRHTLRLKWDRSQLAYLESGVGEWYELAACHPAAELFEATQVAKPRGSPA